MTIHAALPSNHDCSKDTVLTFIVPAHGCRGRSSSHNRFIRPSDYSKFIQEVNESSRILNVFIRPDKGFLSRKNKYVEEIIEQCERFKITYQVSPLAVDFLHELAFVRRCQFLRPRSYTLNMHGQLVVGLVPGASDGTSSETWLPDSAHAQDLISVLDSRNDGIKRRPPRLAEAIMRCVLPRRDRKRQLGDLSEEFSEVYRDYGPAIAHLFYYSQLAASILSWVPRSCLGK